MDAGHFWGLKRYLFLFSRLRVVSNFGDGDCGAGEIHLCAQNFEASRLLEIRARARAYFARLTIAIAKIRDYSQCTFSAHLVLASTHNQKTFIKILTTNW